MCSKEIIKKIDEGGAMVVDKKTIQWGAIIAIVIFVLTQAVVFGIWKGNVDSKLDNFQQTGSKIAVENQHRLDEVIHNLKRLMEKQGIVWERLR